MVFAMHNLQFGWCAGPLPESWASPGAFKNVQLMDLSDTQISGSIPPVWSDATAFPNLVFLGLNHTSLTGSLPAFHNGQLQILQQLQFQ